MSRAAHFALSLATVAALCWLVIAAAAIVTGARP